MFHRKHITPWALANRIAQLIEEMTGEPCNVEEENGRYLVVRYCGEKMVIV